MNDDVDHIFFHNAQVGGGINGLRGAEQHVGELGADHGTAPTVGQAGAQGLVNQCLGHRGATHVGHVQGLRNLAVDGAGGQLVVAPNLLTGLGSTLQETKATERLAELFQTGKSHFMGDVVDVAMLDLDIPLFGDALELLFVFDFVIAICRRAIQSHRDGATMVGVRCGATCGEAKVVASYHAVGIAAANATGRFSGDSARTHRADTAAQALLANLAVGSLGSGTSLIGVGANKLRGLKKTVCRSFHLLSRNKNVPRQRTTSTLFFLQQIRLRCLPTFPHGTYFAQSIGGSATGQVSVFYLQVWCKVKIVLLM